MDWKRLYNPRLPCVTIPYIWDIREGEPLHSMIVVIWKTITPYNLITKILHKNDISKVCMSNVLLPRRAML